MPSTVMTTYGPVSGIERPGVSAWKAIPYAQADRFGPAQPPRPWTHTLAAHDYGPPAPQLSVLDGRLLGDERSCLTLNVWRPALDTEPLPVLLWIHGGAFVTGSGADYDGSALAQAGPAVVVTVNYRLGALGFLCVEDSAGPPPPTPALTDLARAHEWVVDNIAAFGGDPDQITLFGQSAGATLTCALMTTPGARGHFRRAIAFSGAGQCLTREQAGTLTDGHRQAARADGDLAHLQLERLLRITADAVAESGVGFRPMVDGTLLPARPVDAVAAGALRDVALWLGTCRDEMAGFLREAPTSGPVAGVERDVRQRLGDAAWASLRDTYAATAVAGENPLEQLLTDGMWRVESVDMAEAQAAAGGPAWMSRFDYTPSVPHFPELGPSHGADNACLWAHVPRFVERPLLGRPAAEMTEADIAVTRDLQDAVLSFARTGTPGPAAGGDWRRFESTERWTALFDRPPSVVRDPGGRRREAWAALRTSNSSAASAVMAGG